MRASRCLSGGVNTHSTMCASDPFLNGSAWNVPEVARFSLGWMSFRRRRSLEKRRHLLHFALAVCERSPQSFLAHPFLRRTCTGPLTWTAERRIIRSLSPGRRLFSQLRIKDLKRRGSIPKASHTSSKEKGPSALSWKIQNRASLYSCRLPGLFASKLR